jgi:hypothetical protein
VRTGRRSGILRRLVAVVAVAAGALLAHQIWTWPDVAALARQQPATTAFMERYRDEQRARGRSGRIEWRWVAYAAIAPSLKRCMVARTAAFSPPRL